MRGKMTNPAGVQRLKTALLGLGETTEAMARSLMAKGRVGRAESDADCPVANEIKECLGADAYVSVMGDTISWDDVTLYDEEAAYTDHLDRELLIPHRVFDLVHRIDAYEWPELLLDEDDYEDEEYEDWEYEDYVLDDDDDEDDFLDDDEDDEYEEISLDD